MQLYCFVFDCFCICECNGKVWQMGKPSLALVCVQPAGKEWFLHFLMVGKGNKISWHEHYMKFKFQCPNIKLYWNTATVLCLGTIYHWFHAAVATWVVATETLWATKMEIFTIWPFTEIVYDVDFPGGAVVKNPPAHAGDMGLSPGPRRSHMPWSN